jgi:hypothetical protein
MLGVTWVHQLAVRLVLLGGDDLAFAMRRNVLGSKNFNEYNVVRGYVRQAVQRAPVHFAAAANFDICKAAH